MVKWVRRVLPDSLLDAMIRRSTGITRDATG
jgi:hypothetical protein